MKTKWLAALAAVLALSVMGCKDEPESVEVESVTLSETALTLAPGETGKLAATVTPGDADNRTVTWKSSDPAVATVGKDGTVTAHEEGTATVTARAGGKTAECAVTVKRMLIAVEQVTLDKATLTLIRGETGTLTATVTPDDADDRTVAWSSSNDEVATVGSDGTVTAVGKGTATVTAQAGGKEAACEVTVSVAVERVTLSTGTLTIEPGKTRTLTATVTPGDADDRTVTWKSSDETVATVGDDGTVTAHGEGTATITATTRDGGKTAECAVTVRRILIAVERVTLDKATLTLTRGETGTLAATVTPENADDRTVAWSSSAPAVATVDKDGTVTAVKAGEATITAQAGDMTAECAVTVNPVLVTGVALGETTLALTRGEKVKLAATVTPDNADDRTVAWKSSDETIATVGNDGTITAVKVGTATVTATTRDGGFTATCAVTVSPVLVTGIALSETTLALTRGETGKLAATVTPENADDTSVAWKSSDETIATVGTDGTITAVKVGTATVTVTTRDGGFTAECKVTVNPIRVNNVALDITTLTLAPNMTKTLTAKVEPDDADDRTVTWKSSDETVATVDSNGTVTATKRGTATITVTTREGGKTATCAVTVHTDHSYANGICTSCGFPKPSLPGGTIDDNGVLTKYSGTEANLSIPEGVTGIGREAFYNNENLTSVTIPDSVTSIGVCAFWGCGKLETVVIGNKVESIGDYAFYGCSGLTSVTIPASVTSIGSQAFEGCSGLKSVVIPDSVTSIGDYAFYRCSGLKEVTIGNGVTSIGDYAFWECGKLETVVIGNKVESIGEYAFRECSGLKSVEIPGSVTSIGSRAFYRCSGLTGVTIGNGVTSIGDYAFYGCSGLTSVEIPGSVTSIGGSAFSGCSGLKSVTIPDGVTSIESEAFYKCTSLKSVEIPASVTSIGDSAFSGCSGLTEVRYEGNLAQWCDIAWGFNANPLNNENAVLYVSGKELTVADIPDGVTSIGSHAFEGCSGLKSVEIPGSVTSIGGSAFSGCSGLKSVTIGAGVTTIGGYAFYRCNNLKDVHYNGTEKEWDAITKGEKWDSNTGSYTITYNYKE